MLLLLLSCASSHTVFPVEYFQAIKGVRPSTVKKALLLLLVSPLCFPGAGHFAVLRRDAVHDGGEAAEAAGGGRVSEGGGTWRGGEEGRGEPHEEESGELGKGAAGVGAETRCSK